MKNWLTSLHGIAIALLLLSKVWAPAQYQANITTTIEILTASGLLSAKDFNTHSTVGEVETETKKEMNK